VSEYRQSYSTTVAAPASECFAVLTAFEDYPRWSSPITACRVLERGPDGLPKRVEFALDMTVKTIRYVLDYAFDPPHGATWKLVEGDVKDVEGSYRFEEAGAGTTTATCTQGIDLGFWLPGFIRSGFERKALRDSVEEFRAAVEAHRTRGAGGRS
jgi:ribosome-associated toxin RatA of RatAB toxin-antitoxin module